MTAGSFRFEPPRAVHPNLITRPRLLTGLQARFEVRLTVVRAGAGFGKTTALAQAVAEQRMLGGDLDFWLQCRPTDASPAALLAAMAGCLGAPGAAPTVDAVADAVWAHAPAEVALILDDYHLVASPDVDEVLVDVLGALPRNGHLVVATRSETTIPLARLRAAADLVEITDVDLAFDDAELDELAARRGMQVPEVLHSVRLPAMAQLVAEAGRAGAAEFLWEEVLRNLPAERLDQLARLVPFREIDDELAQVVCEQECTAQELLADLPLVDADPSGSVRFHALWEGVLDGRLPEGELELVLRRGAKVLLDRREFVRAFDAFGRAGDDLGQRQVVRAAVSRPLLGIRLDELRVLAAGLGETGSENLEQQLLGAYLALGSFETEAMSRFEDARRLAAETGDIEIEALCVWRLLSHEYWSATGTRLAALIDRARELAAKGSTLCWALVRLHEALGAAQDHDLTTALRLNREVLEIGGPAGRLLANHRLGMLIDLGCPDLVTAPTAADLSDGPIGAEATLATASWLRGDSTPERALAWSEVLVTGFAQAGIGHQQRIILGTVASIAAYAGRVDRGDELLRAASAIHDPSLGPFADGYVLLAEAALHTVRHDEVAAARLVEELLAVLPIRTMVYRVYLGSMPMVALLAPGDTRDAILGAQLGPALTKVQQMAAALIALREHGDTGPAAALPWDHANLLRCHVLPPHLTELALAAVVEGNAAAERVLAEVPDVREHLRHLAASGHAALASVAEARVKALPARPTQPTRVELLGPATLTRGGVAVQDDLWRRDRVRELLALLVHRGTVSRSDAAAAMWPETEEAKALANLRVHLGYLQRVLEPSRPGDEPPWYVRTSADRLTLHTEELEVDLWEFDRAVDAARRAEERHVASEALEHYRRAVALARGDFLAGAEIGWAVYEQIRVRSAAVHAAVRAGELLLARGEPEEALGYADRATAFEALSERGHRLRISALLATDDRAAARRAGAAFRDELAASGLEPEAATSRLLATLGI